MFFRKDTHPDSTDGVAKKSIKNMDAVVTGVILGGIIASIYGVKKLREHEKDTDPQQTVEPTPTPTERKSIWKRIFSK